MINFLSACEKVSSSRDGCGKAHPYLLHARVGSYLAKKEYKIEDPEILSAILYHTTGRPGMTLLEQIIFTADYIEPGRKTGTEPYPDPPPGIYGSGCCRDEDFRGYSGIPEIRRR